MSTEIRDYAHKDSQDPVRAATPVSVDVKNGAGMDSTVNTDGKSRDAAHDLPVNHANVPGSNASGADSVRVSPTGLAGFDSRSPDTASSIATGADYEVEDLGITEERPAWRTDDVPASVDLAPDEAHAYRSRMAHIVRLKPVPRG